MFKTIVWATDGSDTADHALRWVVELARASDATVVVAHVDEFVVGYGVSAPVRVDNADTREQLEAQVEGLRAAGIDARLDLRSCASGQAAHCISEIADEAHADLVIVGTTGHSRLGGFVVGSVTQQLLRSGSRPVLAVPIGAPVVA
jgi:nucleotide-binding universal stress UspA family protein